MIVPVFWIWPLRVPVTAIAWVDVAAPPDVVLLIVPGAVFVRLPVPETTMQSMTVVLVAGAITAVHGAASAAPELRPTIIAIADVVINRCRIRSRLRFIIVPPTVGRRRRAA